MKGDDSSFSDVPRKSADYYDRNMQTYSESNQNPADFIDEFLGYLGKGKDVLDLGCGPGINAEYMRSRDLQVVGIDLSEKMVEHAKSRYQGIDFRVSDMAKLSFPADSFDGVIASYSLIHLAKDMISSVLAKLYEILRGGGVIYISVQTGKSTEGFFSHPLIPDDQVFLNIFSREEIFNLLSEQGFKVVSHHEKPPQGKVFNFTKLFIIARKP